MKKVGCSMPARKRRIRHAPIVQAFAERLKATRMSRQMTQRELAGSADVTVSYISKLEAGGAAPGIDLLERLATALQVNLSDLLPTPSAPATVVAYREQVKELIDSVVAKAGTETLSMLTLLLTRLSESPASTR
jgi:transcriptional regulator with XRE-family HTH domain